MGYSTLDLENFKSDPLLTGTEISAAIPLNQGFWNTFVPCLNIAHSHLVHRLSSQWPSISASNRSRRRKIIIAVFSEAMIHDGFMIFSNITYFALCILNGVASQRQRPHPFEAFPKAQNCLAEMADKKPSAPLFPIVSKHDLFTFYP